MTQEETLALLNELAEAFVELERIWDDGIAKLEDKINA